MEKKLINRVANSSLKTINLEKLYPVDQLIELDIKPYLFKEIILKEQDFRDQLKDTDWSIYEDKMVTIYCSSDAIIPLWAYMLIGSYLQPFTNQIYYGDVTSALTQIYAQRIEEFDVSPYQDLPVVIKGCSKYPVPASAYMAMTVKLRPVAKSILFGEPCSTVPIYKKPR
ncbi:DUF2480 family protein [Membranihabitans marinus]|uniref:DUF2480 family protein n=1 Tax=Membranihabitans marinus TaxID=1227546 RepID=UPI001F290DDE|nr:DUF2480 family protein [Membranihabitans marinus]